MKTYIVNDHSAGETYEIVADSMLNAMSEVLSDLKIELIELPDASDNTYDEYGVNTKNSFNTPPKG